MNVIPPINIGSDQLISANTPELSPGLYSGATSYAMGAQSGLALTLGKIAVYESTQANNLNHLPSDLGIWWKFIGYVYETYSVATTYSIGYVVTDPATHKIYESQVTGNVGQLLTNESKWLTLGATNRYAMFDMLRDTPTVGVGSITVTFTPGKRINSLALLKLKGESASISMTVNGQVVYTRTIDLIFRRVSSWLDYFFGGIAQSQSFVLFDLPPYTTGVVTVTITGATTTSEVACGACVVGKFVDIGLVQFGVDSDVLNYSTIERDFAGNVSKLVQRRNVPKTINDLWLPAAKVDEIRDLRATLAATPAVWAGSENDSNQDYYETILILGIYKRFSINLAHRDMAKLALELEEI